MTTLYEFLAFAVSAAAALWLFNWLGIEKAPHRPCKRLLNDKDEATERRVG